MFIYGKWISGYNKAVQRIQCIASNLKICITPIVYVHDKFCKGTLKDCREVMRKKRKTYFRRWLIFASEKYYNFLESQLCVTLRETASVI